jgi:uncharacterized membrane-anchored protein YitT (DUF2179 family)
MQHQPSKAIWPIFLDGIQLLAGVLLAAIGLKGFLVPNHFFDGGITGISLLLHELYHWNLGLTIVLLNIPLWIASFYTVGKRFALMMFLSVLIFSICLQFIPNFGVTEDKLLIAVFGGAFLGTGIGLVMRVGGALDGIETSFSITEIILAINVVIFALAAFLFGPETALYSVLTYFTATRCIDYVVEGIQAYTGVTIISAKSEEMKHHLVNGMGRAITIYKGERGHLPGSFETKHDCDIVFTIITRLEMRKLKNLIWEVDPNAFVYAGSIREASGGILTRKSAH